MADSTSQNTTFEWEHRIPRDGYTVYQSGSHKQGNFIQAFVPDSPYKDEDGKTRLIVYLHGFALCMPKFYERHLEELVVKKESNLEELAAKKGYYVFFPDFQKSDYPDTIGSQRQTFLKSRDKKSPLSFWFAQASTIIGDTISRRDTFQSEDYLSEEKKQSLKFTSPPGKLVKPSRFKYLRLSLALVAIILVLKLIYSWFQRNYGKNLIDLISTVAYSLLHSPSEWIDQAIDITEMAWNKLCKDNPDIAQSDFDFYVFGHSLGGLLALSWPAYLTENQQKFCPKQIITADPAPSTEMGIPTIAIWILKLFGSPFATQPIAISQTGCKLNVPVAIMHGIDDTLVKPESWVKPPLFQKKSNFDYIASQEKKIYFSLSNKEHKPPLIAFHNQAVTDTTYFDDDLFKFFGGVKERPNLYNWQYVWPGVDLVVTNQAKADELLKKFNVPGSPVRVTDTLPEKPIDFTWIIIAIAVALALWGLGYWFWHAYIPL